MSKISPGGVLLAETEAIGGLTEFDEPAIDISDQYGSGAVCKSDGLATGSLNGGFRLRRARERGVDIPYHQHQRGIAGILHS
jgi:hypothetical protein